MLSIAPILPPGFRLAAFPLAFAMMLPFRWLLPPLFFFASPLPALCPDFLRHFRAARHAGRFRRRPRRPFYFRAADFAAASR